MAASSKPGSAAAAYDVICRIGKGAFGNALLMRRRADGKECVIKDILLSSLGSQHQRDWALQEVELLRNFDHPGIVHYLDSFVDVGADSLCIVMEYCNGGDLAKRIASQRTPFVEELVADWFGQLCLALKYVHDRRIIHRDIKPANIFLMRKDNVVKLGDFGVACTLDSTKHLAHTKVGTPYYISPEIVKCEPYNNKTDVWSLGCVLYELLTLKRAFDGKSDKQVYMNIKLGSLMPIPASYSTEMGAICSAMLRKSSKKRPNIRALLKNDSLRRALLKRVSADELAAIQQTKPDRAAPKRPTAVAAARNNIKWPLPLPLPSPRPGTPGSGGSGGRKALSPSSSGLLGASSYQSQQLVDTRRREAERERAAAIRRAYQTKKPAKKLAKKPAKKPTTKKSAPLGRSQPAQQQQSLQKNAAKEDPDHTAAAAAAADKAQRLLDEFLERKRLRQRARGADALPARPDQSAKPQQSQPTREQVLREVRDIGTIRQLKLSLTAAPVSAAASVEELRLKKEFIVSRRIAAAAAAAAAGRKAWNAHAATSADQVPLRRSAWEAKPSEGGGGRLRNAPLLSDTAESDCADDSETLKRTIVKTLKQLGLEDDDAAELMSTLVAGQKKVANPAELKDVAEGFQVMLRNRERQKDRQQLQQPSQLPSIARASSLPSLLEATESGGDADGSFHKWALRRSAEDVNEDDSELGGVDSMSDELTLASASSTSMSTDVDWDDGDGLPIDGDGLPGDGDGDPAVLAERLHEELVREAGLELLQLAYDLAEQLGRDPRVSEADTERQVRAALGKSHAALYDRLMLLMLYERRAAE